MASALHARVIAPAMAVRLSMGTRDGFSIDKRLCLGTDDTMRLKKGLTANTDSSAKSQSRCSQPKHRSALAIASGFTIWRDGDITAASVYTFAAAASGAGVIYSTVAVFNASLMGPLGIAIILAAASYGMIKLAESKESSSIERWAIRCHFGKANESPAIHWKYPEHADIAFAELNAATLGIEAGVKFETQRADPTLTAKIGWIAQAATEQKLTFKILLPNINASSYSYHWSLTVHRHGDGVPSNYTSGEIIATGSHEVLHPLPTSQKKPSSRPSHKIKDYRADTLNQKTSKKSAALHSGGSTITEFITGHIELTPSLGKHSIQAATFNVTYWPDRNSPEAYANLETKAINE